MSKGMTRIRLQDMFTLEENNKGTRGNSLISAKLRCSRDCWKHIFQENGCMQQGSVGSRNSVLSVQSVTLVYWERWRCLKVICNDGFSQN